jgi:hypothetical protein
MHDVIDGNTFVFAEGIDETFYGDTFQNCRLRLEGGKPRFVTCIFQGCTFEPDIRPDEGWRVWQPRMFQCVVDTMITA